MCWNDEVERIVQTMVYERDGQIYDILRPGKIKRRSFARCGTIRRLTPGLALSAHR